VAAAVATLGIIELRSQRAEAAQLRSQLLASTCAARLEALAARHYGSFIERSAQRAGADFLVLNAEGGVLETSLTVDENVARRFLEDAEGTIELDLQLKHFA